MAQLLVCFYFVRDLDFYKFVSLSLLSPFVEITYMNSLDQLIQDIEKELAKGYPDTVSMNFRRYTEGYLDGLKAAKRCLLLPSDDEIEQMAEILDA